MHVCLCCFGLVLIYSTMINRKSNFFFQFFPFWRNPVFTGFCGFSNLLQKSTQIHLYFLLVPKMRSQQSHKSKSVTAASRGLIMFPQSSSSFCHGIKIFPNIIQHFLIAALFQTWLNPQVLSNKSIGFATSRYFPFSILSGPNPSLNFPQSGILFSFATHRKTPVQAPPWKSPDYTSCPLSVLHGRYKIHP